MSNEKENILFNAEIQDRIRDHLCTIIGSDHIDGAGCDSGNEVEFTLSEISQALNYLIDQRDEAREEIARLNVYSQELTSGLLCTEGEKPPRPERAVILTVKIGGDTWADVVESLEAIAFRIHAEGPITSLVSGGYSSGYIVTGRENEGQTGENYRRQNDEYVKGLPDAKST